MLDKAATGVASRDKTAGREDRGLRLVLAAAARQPPEPTMPIKAIFGTPTPSCGVGTRSQWPVSSPPCEAEAEKWPSARPKSVAESPSRPGRFRSSFSPRRHPVPVRWPPVARRPLRRADRPRRSPRSRRGRRREGNAPESTGHRGKELVNVILNSHKSYVYELSFNCGARKCGGECRHRLIPCDFRSRA
jgi:hypothetical protein